MKNDKSKVKSILSKSTQLLLSSLMTVSLMFTVPLSSQITAVVADDDDNESLYEPIEISKTSLNANTIFGGNGDYGCTGLDGNGFYSAKGHNSAGLPDSGQVTVGDVSYQLVNDSGEGEDPYYGKDSIKISGDGSGSIESRTKTMNLRSYGAYESVYVLATMGGPGNGVYAKFKVTITYTDTTTAERTYALYDWFDTTYVDGVEQKRNYMRINTSGSYSGTTTKGPILHSAKIVTSPSKLIKSISFTYEGGFDKQGNGGYNCNCGIYAVTGKISENAPGKVKNITADIVNDKGDTTWDGTYYNGEKLCLSWDKVTNKEELKDYAVNYNIDIATDKNFQNLVVNNKSVSEESCDKVEDDRLYWYARTEDDRLLSLVAGTKYYCRIRAVNTGTKAGETAKVSVINTNNGKLTTESELSWPKTENAESYVLQASTDSNFSDVNASIASTNIPLKDDEGNDIVSEADDDTCSLSYDNLTSLNSNFGTKTKYYFRILSNIDAKASNTTTKNACIQTSTSQLTKNSKVSWSRVDNANGYTLEVYSDENYENKVATKDDISSSVTDYNLKDFDTALDKNTIYYARIKANGVEGAKYISLTRGASSTEDRTDVLYDSTVSWDSVDGAYDYALSITAKDGSKVYCDNYSIGLPSADSEVYKTNKDEITYDLSQIGGLDHSKLYNVDVIVYMSVDGKRYGDSTETKLRKNQKEELTSTENGIKVGNVVSWESVENVTDYEITLMDHYDETAEPETINTNTNSYQLSDDDNLSKTTSYDVKKVEYTLDNKTVTIDDSTEFEYYEYCTDKVAWSKIKNALNYTITFYADKDCTEVALGNITTEDTSCSLTARETKALSDGIYYVKVKPNFVKTDINVSNTTDGTYLNNSKATWNEVESTLEKGDSVTSVKAQNYILQLYNSDNEKIAETTLDADVRSFDLNQLSIDEGKTISEGDVFTVKVIGSFAQLKNVKEDYASGSSAPATNANNSKQNYVQMKPKTFEYQNRYTVKDSVTEANITSSLTKSQAFTPYDMVSSTIADSKSEGIANWKLESLGQYNNDLEGNYFDYDDGATSDEIKNAQIKAQLYDNIALYMRDNYSTPIENVETYELTGDGKTYYGVILAMTDQTVVFRTFDNPTSYYYERQRKNYQTNGSIYIFTKFDVQDPSNDDRTCDQSENVLQDLTTSKTAGFVKHVHNWEYQVVGSKVYAYCTESENKDECEYQGTKANMPDNAFCLTASASYDKTNGLNIIIGNKAELKRWKQKVDLAGYYDATQFTKTYYYSTGEGMIRKKPVSGSLTNYQKVGDGKKAPTTVGNYVVDIEFSETLKLPAAFSIYGDEVVVPDNCKPQLAFTESVYTGEEQTIVTERDSSDDFVIKYQLTTGTDLEDSKQYIKASQWKTGNYKATDAGTYYVWYKAFPSASNTEKVASQPYCLGSVTIAPKAVTVSYDEESLKAKYDGNGHSPSVTVDGLLDGDTQEENVNLRLYGMGIDSEDAVSEVTEAGFYTAEINLSSNYTTDDETTKTFVVEAKEEDFDVEQTTTIAVLGQNTIPEVTIKFNGINYTNYFNRVLKYSNGKEIESKGIATLTYTVKDQYENFVYDVNDDGEIVEGDIKVTFLVKGDSQSEPQTVLSEKSELSSLGIDNETTAVKVDNDLLDDLDMTIVEDGNEVVTSLLTKDDKDLINSFKAYDSDSHTGTTVDVKVNITSNLKTIDDLNEESSKVFNDVLNDDSNSSLNTEYITYFDLSICKSISYQSWIQGDSDDEKSNLNPSNIEVTETSSPITISMVVPSSMKNGVPANYTRSFVVIRSHENDNGTYEATILDEDDTSYDDETSTISFRSNQFSDFAIVAKDVLNSNIKGVNAVNGYNGSITGLENGYYRYRRNNGLVTITNSTVTSLTGLLPGTYQLAYSADGTNFDNEFEVTVGNTIVNNNNNNNNNGGNNNQNNNNNNNNNQNNNNNNAGSKNNASKSAASNNNASQSAAAATTANTTVATTATTATVAVGSDATSSDGATVTLLSDSEVSYKFNTSSAATVSVPTTQVVNGKSYKVTTLKGNAFNGKYIKRVVLASTIKKINAKAFVGDHKLTYIKINSKTISVSNTAFYGLTKKEKKRIKVVVSKKMSKKNFNALKTKLVKLGLKKSNITRLTK